MPQSNNLEKMILAVAQQRVLQEKKESWNFGWQFKEYRRSKKAYLDHNENRSVIFTQKGLIIYENVVSQLLKQKNIQKLWDKQELWGVIASLIATLPIEVPAADLKREISERISLVFDDSYEIVAFPIANIKWEILPLGIGDMVIGKVDQNWINKISKCAGGRPVINFTEKIRWLSLANSEKSPINAIAIWVEGKGIKGREEAFTKFDNLIDTVLCFFNDHEKNELYSMRGDYNRPGVRGIVIDRNQVSKQLEKNNLKFDLDFAGEIFSKGKFGKQTSIQWFDSNPFPLDDLLVSEKVREEVELLLKSKDEVMQRLILAARWHGKYFWSENSEDSVLALGIAYDCLFGKNQRNLSNLIAERFAYLESDYSKREEAFKKCKKYYNERSDIVHGEIQKSQDVDIREMGSNFREKFNRLFSILIKNKVRTNSEYDQLFSRIKWGTLRV